LCQPGSKEPARRRRYGSECSARTNRRVHLGVSSNVAKARPLQTAQQISASVPFRNAGVPPALFSGRFEINTGERAGREYQCANKKGSPRGTPFIALPKIPVSARRNRPTPG
jgi:hypothetical protein